MNTDHNQHSSTSSPSSQPYRFYDNSAAMRNAESPNRSSMNNHSSSGSTSHHRGNGSSNSMMNGSSATTVNGFSGSDDTYWRMYVSLVGDEEAYRVESQYQARQRDRQNDTANNMNKSPTSANASRKRSMQLSEILN